MKNQFIGKVLNKDIFAENGLLLLSDKTILTHEHLDKLDRAGIRLTLRDLYTEKELNQLELTNKKSSIHNKNIAQDFNCAKKGNILKETFEITKFTNKIPLNEIRKDVLPSIREVASSPNIFGLLSKIDEKDNQLYLHNVAVSVLATAIGRWMKLGEEELGSLTTAALLHDIGKTKVPDYLFNKKTMLTAEDEIAMKRHTLHGFNLISNTVGMSKRIALVALQHHERIDGKGYPMGLKKGQIDLFSEIVAVSDVFNNMTNNADLKNAASFYKVMKQISESAYGKLNPKILNLLIERIMESAIGNEVVLSNEETGRIIMINRFEPILPVIESNNSIIDLSKERKIHIKRVLFS